MSLNTCHSKVAYGIVLFYGERLIISYKGCNLKLSGQSNQPNLSTTGEIFLTSHRIIFLPTKSTSSLESLCMPFICMKEVNIKQPTFGPNRIEGSVEPEHGDWQGRLPFSLTFNHGGAIEFGMALVELGSRATRVKGFVPPPMPPSPSYYTCPPPAYSPPYGDPYYSFVQSHPAFGPPIPGSLFQTSAPPPYPGAVPPNWQPTPQFQPGPYGQGGFPNDPGAYQPPTTSGPYGPGSYQPPTTSGPYGPGSYQPPTTSGPYGPGAYQPPTTSGPYGPGAYQPPTTSGPYGPGAYQPPTTSGPYGPGAYQPPTTSGPYGPGAYQAPSTGGPFGPGSYPPPATSGPYGPASYQPPPTGGPYGPGSYPPQATSGPYGPAGYQPPPTGGPFSQAGYQPPSTGGYYVPPSGTEAPGQESYYAQAPPGQQGSQYPSAPPSYWTNQKNN